MIQFTYLKVFPYLKVQVKHLNYRSWSRREPGFDIEGLTADSMIQFYIFQGFCIFKFK